MKHDIELLENQFLKLSKSLDKVKFTEKDKLDFINIIYGPGYTTLAENFMLSNSIALSIKLSEQLYQLNKFILISSKMIPNII